MAYIWTAFNSYFNEEICWRLGLSVPGSEIRINSSQQKSHGHTWKCGYQNDVSITQYCTFVSAEKRLINET